MSHGLIFIETNGFKTLLWSLSIRLEICLHLLFLLNVLPLFLIVKIMKNFSGYVCNHGSLSGERDTASPRGRYGERLQRDSCLKIHM